MTLALPGKSPRRKATLFIAGLLAIMGGVMLAFSFGAFTHAQTANGTIQVHKYLLNTNSGNWQNQGVGQGPYGFEAATSADFSQNEITFSNLAPSPAIPQQTFWIRETSAPSGQVAAGWFLPEQDSSGNPNCGSVSTDGSGLSPSPLEVNGSVWATTSGNQTGILHLCAYNVPASTIVVKKVANPAGVTSDASTVFSGTLAYSGSFPTGTNQSWSVTGIGGSDTVAGIVPGSYTLTETSPSNGWTLTGFASANSQGVCPTAATAYSANAASLAVDVSPGASATVCVMNLKAAGTRSIHIVKRLQSGASDSSTFSGTISNNGGVGFTGLGVSTSSTDNGQNVSVSTAQSHEIVETGMPSGYTLVGYAVIAGSASSSSCFPGGGLTTTSTAVVPADSQPYVVCIVNQLTEATPSPTPTQTASATPTQTASATPTQTQTASPTPTQSMTTTPTPSASATTTTTPTRTPTTTTPTPTTKTPSPSASPSPSSSPSPVFTPTMTPPRPPVQRPPVRPGGPRPPVTGSGTMTSASGSSLALAAAGLFALSGLLALTALVARRREDS